jgi:AraC-like DNA-binding protein/ligand-binding sensor protein
MSVLGYPCPTRQMNASGSDASPAQQNRNLVDRLRRSKLFRSFEHIFTEITSLPLALQPLEYWQLLHHGKKNENPFCALLAQQSATLAACLESHDEMIRRTGELPHTATCPFGLTETAVPVRLGADIIGYLRIGQVLRKSPDGSDITNVKRALSQRGVRFTNEIRRAWEKSPIIPPNKYNAIVQLLTFFADQLSALCNQMMMEKQKTEPPLVLKAREYIDKHKTEELSLANVAKAVGVSVFHLSKVFHKSTGLKFNDYIARVRLEDARIRLLNPDLRVSDIAYDVGFQSLTQFNRTFKRVFRQSPTEFRAHLGIHKRASKSRITT